MIPKSCKKFCLNSKKCPEPHVQNFIEQLEKANHQIMEIELNSVCYSFMPDPTDNEEFIINIWGI